VNPDSLFVRTLDDLEARTRAAVPEYDVLRSALLLRQLLLDPEPLIERVNRERRVKIRYRATATRVPEDPRPVIWYVQDGLDPETRLAPGLTQEMKKEEFAQPVAWVRAYEFSVRARDQAKEPQFCGALCYHASSRRYNENARETAS
jgi:hypothetical protein